MAAGRWLEECSKVAPTREGRPTTAPPKGWLQGMAVKAVWRKSWFVAAVGCVVLLRLSGTAEASPAGPGQRMLRVVCDDNGGLVTVEPFVLWKGALVHGEDRLIDPQQAARQVIGTGTYYRIDDGLDALPLVHDCAMTLRKVTVAQEGGQIRITETVGDQVGELALDLKDPALGQVWEDSIPWHPVLDAPVFWIESHVPGQWFGCQALAENDDVLCSAIKLYPPNAEFLTMAPIEAEPMPVAPVGFQPATAEPLAVGPPTGALIDTMRPPGPMLN